MYVKWRKYCKWNYVPETIPLMNAFPLCVSLGITLGSLTFCYNCTKSFPPVGIGYDLDLHC